MGKLEVWVGSYNANFHCDFLKLLLEMQECKKGEGDIIQLQKDPKKYQKIALKTFSYRIDPYLQRKLLFIQC
jgi:hypothetical protein